MDFKKSLEARRLVDTCIQGANMEDGYIMCPKCNNKAFYRVIKNNGMWIKCETPDCIDWME